MFHMLRRQMKRSTRLPLIVMTPKSLLRHPLSVSTLKDLTKGSFQPVIPEAEKIDAKKVTRVVFCSGKVYFYLVQGRQKDKLDNVALVRIEQLYPFPREGRSEAHTSELQSLMRISYAVFCMKQTNAH